MEWKLRPVLLDGAARSWRTWTKFIPLTNLMGEPHKGIVCRGPPQTTRRDVLLSNIITKMYTCAFAKVIYAIRDIPSTSIHYYSCHLLSVSSFMSYSDAQFNKMTYCSWRNFFFKGSLDIKSHGSLQHFLQQHLSNNDSLQFIFSLLSTVFPMQLYRQLLTYLAGYVSINTGRVCVSLFSRHDFTKTKQE